MRSKAADASGITSLSPRATFSILAALLVVTLVVSGAVVLGLLFIPGGRDIALPVLAAMVLVHAATMLLTLHLGLRRAGSGWHHIGFLRPTTRILHLLWQIPTIFVFLIAVQALAFLITGSPARSGGTLDMLFAGTSPFLIVAAFVGVVLLTPIWEEVAFRGLVHGGLRRRLGPITASLISAGIFAIFHGVPILLPYMLTLGLSLAYLREFHRTLWAPICMHVTLNGLATGAALVAVLK